MTRRNVKLIYKNGESIVFPTFFYTKNEMAEATEFVAALNNISTRGEIVSFELQEKLPCHLICK